MSLAAKDYRCMEQEKAHELWKLKILSRWYGLRKLGKLPNLTLSNCGPSSGLYVWISASMEWEPIGYDIVEKEVINAELEFRKPAGREDSLLCREGGIKNLG